MSLRESVQVRIRLYPQSAIPQAGAAFAITDTVRDLVRKGAGDGAPPEAVAAQSGLALWGNQQFLAEPELRVVRLSGGVGEGASQGGTEGGLLGFCLRPRIVFRNCRVQGDAVGAPDGDSTFSPLIFKPLKGNNWTTCLRAGKPSRTRIYHTAQVPNADVKIQSEPIPAEQGFRVDLEDIAVAFGQRASATARARIEWGGLFSLLLIKDGSATLQKRAVTSARPGQVTPQWESLRELASAGSKLLDGPLTINVERIGGRMIVTLESGGAKTTLDYLESAPIVGTDDGHGKPRRTEVEVRWPRAPIVFTLYGLNATIGVAFLSHVGTDGRRSSGRFSRTLRRDARGELAPEARLYPFGWIRGGARVLMQADVEEATAGYTCTLEASTDGRASPLVSGVVGQWDTLWAQAEPMGWDISSALSSTLSENGPELGITADAEFSFELSATRLDDLPLPEDAPPGSTWRTTYLIEGGYNPVDISVRERFKNGTYGPWVGRCKGYVYSAAPKSDQWNYLTLNLVVRGPLLRLSEPAARITGEDPSLAGLFPQNGFGDIFAADAIKAVLALKLGPQEAARINGDGNARRFLKPGKSPLLSRGSDRIGLYSGADGKPPTTDQVLLKPPWYKAGLDWIKQLSDDDSGRTGATGFGYGYVSESDEEVGGVGDGEAWPVPIYGDYEVLLANVTHWEIAAASYEEGDADRLIGSAEIHQRPERDVNAWIVANHSLDQPGSEAITPALLVAESRLPPDDPRAEERTWKRTEVVELTTLAITEPYLEALAAGFASESEGLEARYPLLKFRAQLRMSVGDLIKPRILTSTNQSLRIHAIWFRLIKLDLTYSQDDYEYMAQAHVFPLSQSEIAALGLE